MSLKTTIYTPGSAITNPFKIVREAFHGLYSSRELAFRFARRNISAQYRQSLLGIFWAFVPMIISSSIWIFLNGEKIINISTTDIPYPVFVLSGIMLWQGFTDMMNAPLQSVMSNRGILTKINFPREALLFSGFLESLFNFSLKLLLIAVVLLIFGVVPDYAVIFAPVGILMLFLLGQTIGLLLLPFAMLYSDVTRAVGAVTSVWMFLTPVIYPEPKGTLGKILGTYNPVAPILTTTRSWLTGTAPPSLDSFFIVSGCTIVAFIFGLLLFRIALPHLIARIGS